MSARHTQSFKMQAVEKAFSRAAGVTLKEIVDELVISTLENAAMLVFKAVIAFCNGAKSK